MSKLKIAVVEFEKVIAGTIALALVKLGYQVCTIAVNFNSAIKIIAEEKPDLLLLGINFGEQKDGIAIAVYIREIYSIPIIFLTSTSEIQTVQQAREAKPDVYLDLVKPFSLSDLYTHIKIAVSNHITAEIPVAASILLKEGHDFVKIFLKEIMYLAVVRNYVTLFLNMDKKLIVRSSLSEMEKQLTSDHFIKINRGYILNSSYVTRVETAKIFIEATEFPVSKLEWEALIALTERRDIKMVQQAKEAQPDVYLVKPFSQFNLHNCIEIAVSDHNTAENRITASILVKDGYDFVKVFLKEIMYISSDKNYVILYLTMGKKLKVRSTLFEMDERLTPEQFIKINRGYIINSRYVTRVETEKIFIEATGFSVSKLQRDALVALMEKYN